MKTFDIEELILLAKEKGNQKAYGALGYTDGCRCLLGLIGDMAVDAGVATVRPAGKLNDEPSECIVYVDTDGNEGTAFLPPGIVKWAGLYGKLGDAKRSPIYYEQPKDPISTISDCTTDPLDKVLERILKHKEDYFR